MCVGERWVKNTVRVGEKYITCMGEEYAVHTDKKMDADELFTEQSERYG